MLKFSLPSMALFLSLSFFPVAVHSSESPFPADFDESNYYLRHADYGVIPAWVGTRDDEPFDVHAYLESRRPPEKNAAPLYIYAMSRYLPGFEYLYPEEEREEYSKRTQAFSNRVANLCDPEYREEHNVTAAEIDSFLVEARPFMDLIDASQQRPECVFNVLPNLDSMHTYARTSPTIAKICQLEIERAAEKKDSVAIEKSLRRGYRLSRDIRLRGSVICQLLSDSTERILSDSIVTSILAVPDFTISDIDLVLELLKEHCSNSPNMEIEGLKFDYITFGNALFAFENGTLGKSEIVDDGFYPTVCTETEWKAANETYAVAIRLASSLTTNDQYTELIYAPVKRAELEAFKEMQRWTLTGIGLRLGILEVRLPVFTSLTSASFPMLKESHRRQDIHLNGVMMLAAVRRYQIEHGHLPETLKAAAQAVGIEELPIDHFDPKGHALRYVILNGKPVVYSVASDGVDNGGLVDWEFRGEGDFLFQTP